MEGLIPFVYRAIVQYKNGNQGPLLGSWFNDSPSASYIRLPGDSGRFQSSDIQHLFRSSSSSNMAPSSTTKILVSTGVQSPVCRLTSRRVTA